MQSLLNVLTGLGLFLLGMIIMTEGLHALAGDKIRASLIRFTRSPTTGALSGAIATAILQSSSATTVAAVGFVGAGLLTFQQSLGIIFGANIGTTITGWLVALLGIKLQLGMLVLPLILLGALLHLFGKEKLKHIGLAIAGFGLIFVGIDMLQSGMQNLQGWFDFERFPADSFLGRLQLILFGILFTVITQSSSAGVAATLTALFANIVNFEQAAALVIGMDIGTTVTAVIATIGGSNSAKRTGFSHVIYNLMSGILALLIITPYTLALEALSPGFTQENAEIALVAFHTLFNILGVTIALPFTQHFANLMIYFVPETRPHYTRNLDLKMLAEPESALIVVRQSILLQVKDLLLFTVSLMRPGDIKTVFKKYEIRDSLNETQRYIDLIELADTKKEWQSLMDLIHVVDHMSRLFERCTEENERAITASQSVKLKPRIDEAIQNYLQVLSYIENNQWQEAEKLCVQTELNIRAFVDPYRQSIVSEISNSRLDIPEGTRQLEAIRWLKRVSNHITKMIHHYALHK